MMKSTKLIITAMACLALSTIVAPQCLSDERFKSEHRLTKLETAVEDLKAENLKLKESNANVKAELAATRNVFQACQTQAKGSWALKRIDYVFPSLKKVQLHQKTVTYLEKVPDSLIPKNTKAVLISIFCNFWNTGGHAYMNLAINQKGNKAAGIANVYNTHYQVYANTFYYEVMVPWDGSLDNEAVLKLTNTYNTGRNGGKNVNWYQVKIVGVISDGE